MAFPFRPALRSTERSLSPPGCTTPPAAVVMAAPALSLSLRARQPSITRTPSSPAVKTHRPPLSSPPTAHSRPQRSAGRHAARLLDLDLTAPTRTANGRAPCIRPTPRDAAPLHVTTGAHEVQSVTRTEAPLRALHLLPLTRCLGLVRYTLLATC